REAGDAHARATPGRRRQLAGRRGSARRGRARGCARVGARRPADRRGGGGDVARLAALALPPREDAALYSKAVAESAAVLADGNGPLARVTKDLNPMADKSQPQGVKRLRGMGRVYQRGRVWWVQYWYRGQLFRESSESHRRSAAV